MDAVITDEVVKSLGKDLRAAATTLGKDEARFLVDAYYIIQEDRKRSNNQIRSLEEDQEPHELLSWFADQNILLEKNLAKALHTYAQSAPIGVWAMSQIGIGPIISAGLLAHISLDKTNSATSLWRYAGLDPTCKWEKKTKRPWNAALKVLCWKIGESFVKTCNNEASFYGPIYLARKALETERNERGEFAEQAARALSEKNYKKDTDAYKAYVQGKLPPAHIHARAKRYAVKMFLSHYFEMLERYAGKTPTTPYIIAQGHKDYMPPPGI